MKEDMIYTASFGRFPVVFLLRPDLIKLVFEERFGDFEKSAQVQNRLDEVLGDGIFASDGEIWKHHRKVGSKMFSMRNLKTYMFKVAKTGNERWMRKLEELRV